MKYRLMKVLFVQHIRNNKIIYEERNILNTLHTEGEEFLLRVAFLSLSVPSAYYIGLDNRSTIAVGDDLTTVNAVEPSSNGYLRVSAAPGSNFTLTLNDSGNNQINTSIVTFRATSGNWNRPVKNIFLCTSSDNSGYLIASAQLSETITMTAGDMVNMRLGLALSNCP
jgi:hypothetical protein